MENENKEEQYGLITIEIIKKEKMNRLIIYMTLTIVVLVCSSVAGIFVSKASKNKASYDVQNEAEAEPIEEVKESAKLPIYSEEAKERMRNIYVSTGEEKVAYLTFDDRSIFKYYTSDFRNIKK